MTHFYISRISRNIYNLPHVSLIESVSCSVAEYKIESSKIYGFARAEKTVE